MSVNPVVRQATRTWGPCYGWYYQSPWNRAVDELRAARAAQPKALPTPLEWDTLVGLREQKERAWDNLRLSEQDEKAFYRQQYNEAKLLLERERSQVVRDMHRRRRNGTSY